MLPMQLLLVTVLPTKIMELSWTAAFITVSIFQCLQPAFSSYLGYPRIHFFGQYRANTNTRNNDPCNYRLNQSTTSDLNDDWGFNGTEEFQFFNAHVTGVVNETGHLSTDDPVVGQNIIGNLRRPFAKLSDLDVDAQQYTTLFGFKLGIQWSDGSQENDNIAFYGNWTRSIVAQYIWSRLKCYTMSNANNELYQDTFPFGAQSTSVLAGVNWVDSRNSSILTQLHQASQASGGNLAVRINLHHYTRNYPPYVATNATLGYVIGAIGIPSPSDTLNVPGQRALNTTSRVPLNMTFEPGDICYQQDTSSPVILPWMFIASAEVDASRNEVRIDLSNSIPTNLENSLRNLGTLALGVYRESDSCVLLLGNSGIPYFSDNDLPITSGIYRIPVEASLMDQVTNSPLVIAQIVAENVEGTTTRICGEGMFSTASGHHANILLQEFEYFIRPTGYYIGRIDRSSVSNPSVQNLFVTRYGRPVPGVNIMIASLTSALPQNGVVPSSEVVATNNAGIARFEFGLQESIMIPAERQYSTPQCDTTNTTLPIDGQVYIFTYCVESEPLQCTVPAYQTRFVYLAFSDVSYGDSPTWVDDVSPIFSQYAHLTPLMKRILDLGSYTEVTKTSNINLLNITLRLDFKDPSYMPTTRDLSPTKRAMILRWLENPRFDLEDTIGVLEEIPLCSPETDLPRANSPEYFKPPRCQSELRFQGRPQDNETFFERVYEPISINPAFTVSASGNMEIKGRPLFGVMQSANNNKIATICTRENIMVQLQSAIQLEWATIPTYLTSLYSIVDGCNTEIYDMIRDVVIQEMLHMTQSANILIAMGGSPMIDHRNFTPSFPTHLPAGVLPGLVVHLQKLSLQHVHDTFMTIEVPDITLVGNPPIISNNFTIGAFYTEISSCIEYLSANPSVQLFDPDTLPRQVKWPWPPSAEVGTVVPVTDTSSALAGISEIVEQGEGAGLLNPDQVVNGSLAHFFRFEEIVCQRRLEMIDQDTYSYSGTPIPFQAEGVWPMRDNPSVSNVPPDTNCYTESRAFHTIYRNLLRKLQEVFNGEPEGIFEAVELMESLKAHATVLMWTKFKPFSLVDETTCGPVWDYDWPLPEPTNSTLELVYVVEDSSALFNRCSSMFLLSTLLAWALFTR